MPLAPANPALDEEDDLPPAPRKPRPLIGTTGGEIPEQQSDIDARTQPVYSADPAQRRAQVQQQISRQKTAAFQQANPFTPSSWEPKINTPETRRQDREIAGNAEEDFQYQQHTARVAEVDKRRAAIGQRNARNNELEAQYRGSGQQFYADADQNLQPVIDAETGRPLFNASGWQAGTHPKTGQPVLTMRDKFGQRQFKEPPVVQSLDPHDDQMHYKLPDGTTVAAGSIDDFAKSPNYNIAKLALAAKSRQVRAVHQEALQPIRLMADQAVAQLEDTKVEIQGLDAEIEKLSTQVGNATAPDGSPTPLSEGLGASLAQLQARRDQLDGMVKPRGELAQKAARAKTGYAIASATAMREAFAAQQNEIAARVKAQGGNLETDPTYQANLRGLRSAEQILGAGQQEMGIKAAPSATPNGRPANGAAMPGEEVTPGAGPLEQSEPFAAKQNGIQNVGSVKIDEFARRYGDGRGPVRPDQMLKLDRRSKEIEGVLANDESSINQTMRDQFTKEKEYIDSLYKQRFARMTPEQQKRVTDATRDPTFGEKSKSIGANLAEGAGTALADTGEFLARNVNRVAASYAPGGAALVAAGLEPGHETIPEFASAMREVASEWGPDVPPEVQQKLEEAFTTGTLPKAAGSAAAFAAPVGAIGGVGRALKMSEGALRTLATASVATMGAAAGGNSFRREAETALRKQLSSGEISQSEFVQSLGMAELFGAALGTSEAIPIAKFAQRLGGVPTGQGFLQKLFTVAGKGGTQRAAKWLTGGAGKEALTEALEEGGQELVQSLAQDLYASESFDKDRKIGGDAAEQAAAGGITGAILSILTHKLGKGGRPTSGKPEPTDSGPDRTPAQQAAEAEFQKRLADDGPAVNEGDAAIDRINKGIRDQGAKDAAESAEIFEPALKEKANVPPPAKSAAESAAVMQDVATTEEADAKVASQQEAKAQQLVDQIQEATGRSREEILSSRKGRDVAEWTKELETDAKYHADPLVVDPDRRVTELNGEIAKHDEEWARHLEQTAADAENHAKIQGDKDKAAEQFMATRDRHEALMERKAAIESELAKAERVRKSAKGGADLKADLAAKEGRPPPDEPGAAPAKKAGPTEPPSGAKTDHARYKEIEAEWAKAVKDGKADMNRPDIKKLFAENEEIKNRHGGMPPVEAKAETKAAARSGAEVVADIMAKNPNADERATKMLVGKKNYEVRDVPLSEIGEVFGSKTVQPDVVKKYEGTKSDEPIVLGRVAGSTDKSLRAIDGKHRLTAAKNRGDKTIRAYVPVEAKAEVKEEAKPTEPEPKVAAPAPVAAPKVEAVHEITPPKDAAPVSAGIEQHTAETVEGDKINKNWTAFGPDSGTLGIPRAEMPQIKSSHRGALVNFLKARGVETKTVMVRPGDLKPTQAEFSPAKVDTAREHRGSERPILISADGHLIDGHHQWMAGLQDDPSTPMPAIKLNAPVDKLLAEIKEFPSTESAPGIAAKAAAKEPSVSAPVATKRLSDRAIEALQNAKIDTKGKLFDVTQGAYVAAHNAAIDLAILGVRAGRAAVDVTKLAVQRFKAKFPKHTPEQIEKLEASIHTAIAEQPPEPEPGTAKSKVPESLREVGVPANDIEYDVRAQNDRMKEARAAVSKEGAAKAEEMIADRNLPADTRVAIGGVLLEQKMTELANAKPEDAERITREIQRITNATRSGVSTESGQGVAMHAKIYENLAVGSAMEYTKAVTKERVTQMGGKETIDAADAAAKVFNKTKDQKTRDAEIEKLKEKYSTKPARRMLDQLKRIEVIKDLNKLGVLTKDDMVNVAGNAIGIPGISAKKLKHIADLANEITNAKDHSTRSRAELKLADTLHIYKGVNPLDLEASMLTLNILSGPSTQIANLEGNALNLLTQLGTTAMVNPAKLGPIMKGVMEGIPLGWDQAKSILATGRGTKDFQDRTLGSSNALQNVDYARDFPKLNEKVGDVLTARARVIEKISRFMKAADAVFYYPAREAYARLVTTKLLEGNFKGEELSQKVSEALHTTAESFEAAKKQATAEGYEGIDLSRRVADIIEESRSKSDVGKQAVKESERFAAEATFNNEPVGLAGVIYRNLARTVKDADIGGVPVLKPWAMFLRVPANVFNATTNFTPVGASRAFFGVKGEKYRKGGTGENQWRNFTKDERNRLYLQSVIGTTLMAALTARILDKDDVNISAAGPNDPSKKAQLKTGGWNPYSIKVGNRWVSYKDSPLLVPLAIVGHVADAVRYQKSKSDLVLGSKVADAVSHAPQIIFQTSMLSGLSDLMSALGGQGDVMKSLERTLGSIPANLAIPYNRLLQQVDQSFDDKVYKENAAVDAVPFARRNGEVQTDIQGRARTFSPFARFTTEENKDPVDSLLRQKNVFIPEAGKDSKVGNRVMTDDEYTKYRRMSGQRIRARLQLIAPQLRGMNQEKAQERVEQISREERAKVRPLLIGSGVRR